MTSDNLYQTNYEEMSEIGQGASAIVKKCALRSDKSKVFAAKIMRNRDEEKELACRAEFDLINSLAPHPNII